MRPRDALFAIALLSLAAAGCSRLTFIKANPKVKDVEYAPAYEFKQTSKGKRNEDARNYVLLAQNSLQSGQYDQAEQKLREALRVDPKSADAYVMFGVLEEQRGRGAQAGGYYAKAAELAPGDGVALNNYGAWLCGNGRAGESLPWFDRALADQTYMQRASALANAGACALKAGDAAHAEPNLRAALQLEDDNAVALQAMADYQYRSGRYMEARAFSERRLAAESASRESLQLAAQIEDKLGDKAAAARYVQRLKTEFPQAQAAQSGESSQP